MLNTSAYDLYYGAARVSVQARIDGNWRKLLADQVGFHVQVCYGDYLREVGYALKKMKQPAWENFSESPIQT